MRQYGFYLFANSQIFSADLDGLSLGVQLGQKGVDVMTEFGARGMRTAGVSRTLTDCWVSRKGKWGTRPFETNRAGRYVVPSFLFFHEWGVSVHRSELSRGHVKSWAVSFTSGPQSGPGKWDTLRRADEKAQKWQGDALLRWAGSAGGLGTAGLGALLPCSHGTVSALVPGTPRTTSRCDFSLYHFLPPFPAPSFKKKNKIAV